MRNFVKMLRVFAAISAAATLSSCSTLDQIQHSEAARAIESLKLSPVQPDSFWYDGRTYEYNSYKIAIISSPVRAHIIWNGKFIGDTPFNYYFTGMFDKNETVVVRAMPFDEKYATQEASLKISQELPRQINFVLLER
jgi:hypothetical protein